MERRAYKRAVRSVLLLAAPFIVALVGCSSRAVPVSSGTDGGAPSGNDGGTAFGIDGGALDAGQTCTSTGTPWVNTLFIVDNSSSMAEEQTRLAAAIPRYVAALRASCAPGYNIAVVSTDLDTPGGEKAGLFTSTFAGAPLFELSSTDASGCQPVAPSVEHGCARGGVVAHTEDPSTQRSRLAANVQPGTCGSGTEKGIEAIGAALSHPGCNGMLGGGNVRLVVILVSDEDDAGLEPIAPAVTALAQQLGPRVRVGAIVAGQVVGDRFEPGNCRTGGASCGSLCQQPSPVGSGSGMPCTPGNCPAGEYCTSAGVCDVEAARFWQYCHWCSFYNAPDCCSAVAGDRYVSFVEAMEAANFAAQPTSRTPSCPSGRSANCRLASICDADWGDTLERFAQLLALGR